MKGAVQRTPGAALDGDEQRFINFFDGPGADALDAALTDYDHDAVTQTYPQPVRFDWQALDDYDEKLARNIRRKPTETLTVGDHALRKQYEVPRDDGQSVAPITVLRPVNLPAEHIHPIDLIRSQHLDELIGVATEVVEVNPVEPMISSAAYECRLCGTLMRVPQSPYAKLMEPAECMGCEKSEFGLNESQSEFDDCQLAKVKAADPSLDSPRVLRIFLENDLCGRIRKDEQVGMVGVYKTLPFDHPKQKGTNMETYLKVVSLDKEDTSAVGRIDDAELAERVINYVSNHEAPETTDDEQWYVSRSDVEQAVAGQTAAATSDVRACINELLDENKLIRQASNRLAVSS
jgi:replicative DNA helicase Mcm